MSETKWTPAEDKLLLQLADKGKTYAQIAEIMQRPHGGIRNRLSRLRNPEQNQHRIIIHNMSAEDFGELIKAKECIKEYEQNARRAEAFAGATYDDYRRLYDICENLLKAYKNHRNTKAAFDRLEADLREHIPCPF